MMSDPFDPLLGFSPLQLAIGGGALVTGANVFIDGYSVKESIKSGVRVAAGAYVLYSLIGALRR